MKSHHAILLLAFTSACSSTPSVVVDDGGTSTDSSTATPTHVVIDFDELQAWAPVSTQYAQWVTFSTDAGSDCEADSNGTQNNASPPNYLACGTYPYFVANIELQFTAPARNLKLRAIGVNSQGPAGTIQIFQNGSSTATTYTVTGLGNPLVPVDIDLSSYTDITSIQIVDSADFDGFGIDDISFDE